MSCMRQSLPEVNDQLTADQLQHGNELKAATAAVQSLHFIDKFKPFFPRIERLPLRLPINSSQRDGRQKSQSDRRDSSRPATLGAEPQQYIPESCISQMDVAMCRLRLGYIHQCSDGRKCITAQE